MEILYVFMSTSKVHLVYLQQKLELHPTKQVPQLQRLSETRWACRYLAIDAVCTTFDSILSTLEIFMDGNDRAKATEATGILLQVRSFKFLLSLVIFSRILTCTKCLFDLLQCKNIDMAKAAYLVIATIETFETFRSDSHWEQLSKYVEDVAALHNIGLTPPRPQRQRQLPRKLDDCVVSETTGSRELITRSTQWKIFLYFTILEAIAR